MVATRDVSTIFQERRDYSFHFILNNFSTLCNGSLVDPAVVSHFLAKQPAELYKVIFGGDLVGTRCVYARFDPNPCKQWDNHCF